MGVRVFALLALVVGSSAFEIDVASMTAVTDHLHEHFVSELRSLVHEHITPKMALTSLKDEATDAACGKCVQMGTKFVMEHAAAKMKDMCAKASGNSSHSCIASKVCGMMGKHPKVTLGMMMEHVRPHAIAMAFCFGKGACKKPDSAAVDEIVTGAESHQALLDNFDKVDWSEVQ
jgi:hypothetical protein